jgi:RimJ/RimL family protein N-acetyltransferase
MEAERIVLDHEYSLEPLRPEDAAAHRRFALDPDAARFLGWIVEQAQAGEAVGMVELRPRPSCDEASVSYLVAPELRSRGLAAAGVEAALEWGRSERGLRRATIACHVDSVASRRVAEKCGFLPAGNVGDDLCFRRDLVPTGRSDA